jgi:hypothetical protein
MPVLAEALIVIVFVMHHWPKVYLLFLFNVNFAFIKYIPRHENFIIYFYLLIVYIMYINNIVIHGSLALCPGQNQIITPLPFFH